MENLLLLGPSLFLSLLCVLCAIALLRRAHRLELERTEAERAKSQIEAELARAQAEAERVRAEAEALRQEEESLRISVQRLETLRAFDFKLLKRAEPDEVGRSVAQFVRDMVGCERAAVLLFDPSGKRATLLSSQEGVEKIREEELPLSDFTRVTGLDRGASLINDATQGAREMSLADRLWQGGLRFGFRLPLVIEGEWSGSINLSHRTPEPFTESSVCEVRELSERVARALSQSARA
jgi:transcriptional regulator with GAF, ATPase, and Fis domain